MLRLEGYVEIQVLKHQRKSIRAISAELGVSRNTEWALRFANVPMIALRALVVVSDNSLSRVAVGEPVLVVQSFRFLFFACCFSVALYIASSLAFACFSARSNLCAGIEM